MESYQTRTPALSDTKIHYSSCSAGLYIITSALLATVIIWQACTVPRSYLEVTCMFSVHYIHHYLFTKKISNVKIISPPFVFANRYSPCMLLGIIHATRGSQIYTDCPNIRNAPSIWNGCIYFSLHVINCITIRLPNLRDQDYTTMAVKL